MPLVTTELFIQKDDFARNAFSNIRGTMDQVNFLWGGITFYSSA